MSRIPSAAWVVMSDGRALPFGPHCTRCGAHDPWPELIDAGEALARAESFQREHASCPAGGARAKEPSP